MIDLRSELSMSTVFFSKINEVNGMTEHMEP